MTTSCYSGNPHAAGTAQIEKEDFRTESQPRRLRLGKLRQLQPDPL